MGQDNLVSNPGNPDLKPRLSCVVSKRLKFYCTENKPSNNPFTNPTETSKRLKNPNYNPKSNPKGNPTTQIPLLSGCTYAAFARADFHYGTSRKDVLLRPKIISDLILD